MLVYFACCTCSLALWALWALLSVLHHLVFLLILNHCPAAPDEQRQAKAALCLWLHDRAA